MGKIAENLERVRARIARACEKAGREAASVTLVAVSKTKTAAEIHEACKAGQTVFGENYAQELRDKALELKGLPIEWHFIGHLQKNKAKLITPIAEFVESIDSIELAEALDKRALRKLQCLIEVNIGDETSKSGAQPENVVDLARGIMAFEHLELAGLMTIPPYIPDPERSRPYFKKLKRLLAELNDALKLESPLRGLSMGMSHDFEVAIEEGATIVRVGTAIFGERP